MPPSLQDIYTTHRTLKALTIMSDAMHPAQNLMSLLPSALSLTCHQCISDGDGAPCTDSKMNCSTQCGSLRVVTYAGGQMVHDMSMKSCVLPQQCITGSFNVGLMKMVINSKCCKTDNCNAQDAPATTGDENGKECYTCTGPSCTSKMKCEGEEENCISASFPAGDQKMAVKGCASKSLCAGELAEQLGGALEDITCCQGNVCNGAGDSGPSPPIAEGGVAEIESCAAITIILSVVISLLFH
ncbi:phospholipase A2 inhibitor and Ly6/PLAUR domain-containing protein-like [Engraulis encrasicolus]|uniref:phospholipase A2 inhibitor and Ly6/PLAUR domain-containing protein-like n=1 Tax=Engraulis encrasicolus TaxID=184585 RepID=UPI002FD6DBF8